MRFRADGTGKVAIYQPGPGGSDDVFDNPLVDLDRVVWHSDFVSRGFLQEVVVEKTLTPSGVLEHTSIPIYTHNLGIIPYVEADLLDFPNAGQRTPFSGSIPIGYYAVSGYEQHRARTVSLNWDRTRVYVILYHGPTTASRAMRFALRIGDWEVPTSA